jgi:hypothetical protein
MAKPYGRRLIAPFPDADFVPASPDRRKVRNEHYLSPPSVERKKDLLFFRPRLHVRET